MSTADVLADAIGQQRDDERRKALRALLRHPLLTPTGPDSTAFTLVRRHAPWLHEWVVREAGWSLHVDASVARLRKHPGSLADRTRGAIAESGKLPFSRQRYVLTCLALAVLERAEGQVTLGYLAERILALAQDPALVEAGFRFAFDSRDQRSDLAVVARLLLSLRVLAHVAGDEQSFVASSGDALYDVDRRVLASLLVVRRGASTVAAADFEERLQAISEELVADTDEGRNRATRHRLARRLLDDPVLYLDDLEEDEQAYLRSQRAFLARRLGEATGLVAEMRAEGMAMLDPTGEATDLAMPEEGTDGHATLLLAEHLADCARRHPAVPVDEASLVAEMARLSAGRGKSWRKSAREPGAETALTRLALDRLEALGLVRRTPAGIVPRPALARFTYLEPTLQAPLPDRA